MKIVCISDTHEQHEQIIIPECDVLVHAGDITKKGSLIALYEFCAWMKKQPAKYKCIIYGNHEIGFSRGPKREEALATPKQFGITYLENSSTEIEGIKFYGSPVQPWFHDWEWNVHRGPDIARVWEAIPDDTQVLITHGPPFGILDSLLEEHPFFPAEKLGCEDLLNRVNQLSKLKAHIFGHIHSGHGSLVGSKGIQFINAAICDDVYKHVAVNKPIVFDI